MAPSARIESRIWRPMAAARSAASVADHLEAVVIKAIVTDIEGTTSSIRFVKETLFPFARARMRSYLREHAGDALVQALIDDVEAIVGWDLSLDDAADILERWIDEDRKDTPLKTLQGMIWRLGYDSGELRGHVYDDTPQALQNWKAAGIALYVYSSGSVDAQKLIFGHTDYGDLSALFTGFFDTRVGAKRDPAAYRAILRQLQLDGGSVLFLSDIAEELQAARSAGLHTCQLVRDEATVPAPGFAQARSLRDVNLPT